MKPSKKQHSFYQGHFLSISWNPGHSKKDDIEERCKKIMVEKAEKKTKSLLYTLYCIWGKPMPRGHNLSLGVCDLLTTVKKKSRWSNLLLFWENNFCLGRRNLKVPLMLMCALLLPWGSQNILQSSCVPAFQLKLLKRSAQNDHIQKRWSFSPAVGVFVVLISRQVKKPKEYISYTIFQESQTFQGSFSRISKYIIKSRWVGNIFWKGMK